MEAVSYFYQPSSDGQILKYLIVLLIEVNNLVIMPRQRVSDEHFVTTSTHFRSSE
jgi:hypothetical protein